MEPASFILMLAPVTFQKDAVFLTINFDLLW